MTEPVKIQGTGIIPIPGNSADNRAAIGSANATAKDSTAVSTSSFADMLRVQQGIAPVAAPAAGALKFSAHAQTRLQSRQISLDSSHLNRLQGAVQRAAGKGSRDALILMDDLAMVVSVSNRTVITVVDKDSMKQNVFTNIDSAVIA